MNRKFKLLVFLMALLLYLVSYLLFRNTHIETWDRDNRDYVLFPKDQRWLYYLYRPLTYADNKITDMRFHIGPHQP